MYEICIETLDGKEHYCYVDETKYQSRIETVLKYFRTFPDHYFDIGEYFDIEEKFLFIKGAGICAITVKEKEDRRKVINE